MPAGVLIVIGLAALLLGAELVVRCGSSLARGVGVPPLLVGLTIVSIGTSAPELAVGIDAFSTGAGSLAIGNIAGTNIVNLLLILGLSAAIRPLVIGLQTLKLDLPAMSVSAVLLLVLCWDGSLSRVDGVILLGLAVVYTTLLFVFARREPPTVQEEFARAYPVQQRRARDAWLQLVLLLAGIGIIVVGADWLVTGAVDLAQSMGVSDAFIGLTIVAIGTSAPEFATTIVSTIRGDRDIAIGNLIGSSTFNLTLVLGTSLLFAPGAVAVDAHLLTVDLPVMVAVSLVCIPVFRTGRRVSRFEGIAFVAAYLVYLAYLVIART